MIKRVFISRDLAVESPFRSRLSAAGFEVTGRSLVTFNAIAFLSPPSADWVFCYSARSVDFFLLGLNQIGIPPDDYANYAALGRGTARRLASRGITPAFVGSGEPMATAVAFLEQARGKSVLFPRAEQSRQSIQRLLEGKLEMLDLVVYRNEKIRDPKLPLSDYVVLTSPLNAEAYFSAKNKDLPARMVVIGPTTASALQDMGVTSFRMAAQATEEALADAVLNWEKS